MTTVAASAAKRSGPATAKTPSKRVHERRRATRRAPQPYDPAHVAWRALHREACAPYRRAGRFAWYFARGKLQRDPAFRGLLECGALKAHARILDIGCGQGLLASLLRTVDRFEAQGRWPHSWPNAPRATRYVGLELMAREVRRAEAALAPEPVPLRATASFICADMVGAELPRCDAVVILDVLHYVDPAAQERVLRQVACALVPGGRLLLRVGDASQRRASEFTRWIDRIVALARRRRFTSMHTRPLAEWMALLESLGFAVSSLPMSRGTPFANVLLLAERLADRLVERRASA